MPDPFAASWQIALLDGARPSCFASLPSAFALAALLSVLVWTRAFAFVHALPLPDPYLVLWCTETTTEPTVANCSCVASVAGFGIATRTSPDLALPMTLNDYYASVTMIVTVMALEETRLGYTRICSIHRENCQDYWRAQHRS